MERDGGREQSKEEQKRLQCCREPSLFASGLTNRKRTGKTRGQKKSRGKEMGEEIYLIGEKEFKRRKLKIKMKWEQTIRKKLEKYKW